MNKVNTQAERDEVAKKEQVNLLRRIKLNEAQRQSVDSRFKKMFYMAINQNQMCSDHMSIN